MNWRPRGRDLSGQGKKANRGIHFLETEKGGTCQDTEKKQWRGIHSLESTEGGTSQDTEGMRLSQALTSWKPQKQELVRTQEKRLLSEGHSLSGDHRGRDLSGYRRNASNQAIGTHFLEAREGGTCQHIEGM